MRFHVASVVTLLAACAVGQEDDPPPQPDAAARDAKADVFAQPDASFADVAAADVADAAMTPEASSSCSFAGSGALVTYDFTGQPGNQVSTAATSKLAGVTAGAISRASTLTAITGTNSINGGDWSTGALDATRYYTFTISPPSSCALAITSISIETQTSSTGPTAASIATSADAFASKTTFTLNTTTSVALSVSGAATTVEVRVYGYDASGTAGTMRIEDTVTASGSLM